MVNLCETFFDKKVTSIFNDLDNCITANYIRNRIEYPIMDIMMDYYDKIFGEIDD